MMSGPAQLERLEEEKLNLRKQLIDRALSRKTDKISPAHRGPQTLASSRDKGGEESVDGDLAVGSRGR